MLNTCVDEFAWYWSDNSVSLLVLCLLNLKPGALLLLFAAHEKLFLKAESLFLPLAQV